MQLDPRRYEVAIKQLQTELNNTKSELERIKKDSVLQSEEKLSAKFDKMLGTKHIFPHTATSSTFNLTSTNVDMYGTTLRLYFAGTSKSAITAGNITNIVVATFVIDNSDLLIRNVLNANTTGGGSGVLSQYVTSVSFSEDMKKITVTVTLAAIGTNISSGGTQNAYIPLPVILNYDAF